MIKTEHIRELQGLVTLSKLCEMAGLNVNTIRAKIINNRPLTTVESEKFENVLREHSEYLINILQ